eukprot:NODE_270_length_11220_cov_0.981387.p1 type:complete len:1748 gc:universal NODE_270_length_11220_cov_0.981387:884-6127(+)
MSHLEIHSAISRLKRKMNLKVQAHPLSESKRDIEKNIALIHAIDAKNIDLELVTHLCNCLDSPKLNDATLSTNIFLHGLSVVYHLLRISDSENLVTKRLYQSILGKLKESPSLISQIYCKEYFLEFCHHAKDILPYVYGLFQNSEPDYQKLITEKEVISSGPLDVFCKPKIANSSLIANLNKLVRFGTNEAMTCATLITIVLKNCPTWYLDYLTECLIQNQKYPDISSLNVIFNFLYLSHHYPDLKAHILNIVDTNLHSIGDKNSLIAVGELIANCVPFDSVAWLYSFMDSAQAKGLHLKPVMYIACGFISCHVDQPKTLDLAISQLLRVVTKSLKSSNQPDLSIKTLGKEMSLNITKKLNEVFSGGATPNEMLKVQHQQALRSMVSLTNFDELSDPLFVLVDVLTIIAQYIIGSCSDYAPQFLCGWQFNRKESESKTDSLSLYSDILQNLADLAQGQSSGILMKQKLELQNGPVHDALFLHVLDSFLDLADASLGSPKYHSALLSIALSLFEQKSWNILKLVDDKDLFKEYVNSFGIGGDFSFGTISKIAQKELFPVVPLIEKILCDRGKVFVDAVVQEPSLDLFMKSIDNYNDFVSQFRAFWVFFSLFNFDSMVGEMSESFTRIAFFSPVLFPPIVSQSQEEEIGYKKTLDYNPYREVFTSDPRLGLIGSAKILLTFGEIFRLRLKDVIRDTSVKEGLSESQMNYLSAQECLHLLAIFDLEYKRVLAGRHEFVNYLAAFDLSTGAQAASTSYKHSQGFILFKSCLRAAVSKILEIYLISATTTTLIDYYEMIESDREKYKWVYLEKQAQHLLFHCCCHPLSEVHKFSVAFIEELLKKYPALMWSKGMLFLCLDLIQILNKSVMDIERSTCCFYYQVPSAGRRLYLPDDLDHRKLVYKDLSTFLVGWIEIGAKESESESYIVIREYIMKGQLQSFWSADQHKGIYIAMDVLKRLQETEKNHIMSLRNFEGKIAVQSFYEGYTNVLTLNQGFKNIEPEILQFLKHTEFSDFERIERLLHLAAEYLALPNNVASFVFAKFLIWVPVKSFEPKLVMLGVSLWSWVIYRNADIEDRFLSEVVKAFQWTAKHKMGIFNIAQLKTKDPFKSKISYSVDQTLKVPRIFSHRLVSCHAMQLKFLIDRVNSGSWNPYLLSKNVIDLFSSVIAAKVASHASVRPCFLLFISLGFRLVRQYQEFDHTTISLLEKVFEVAMQWFSNPAEWYDGENQFYPLDECKVMLDLFDAVDNFSFSNSTLNYKTVGMDINERLEIFSRQKRIFLLFLESEIEHVNLSKDPLNAKFDKPFIRFSATLDSKQYVLLTTDAWNIDPKLAFRMIQRYPKELTIQQTFKNLIMTEPDKIKNFDEAVLFLANSTTELQVLNIVTPIHPLRAITFFLPPHGQNPQILQYALRSLQQYPIENTFFFIPQVVQALRYDVLGYVEQFVLRAAKASPKFSHQIIWNMKANFYSDTELGTPDPMKPTFEKIIKKIENLFEGEALSFYKREFDFFAKVTNISKILKPFVKESKDYKKRKIDDELSKIKVDVGVYLPSSPEVTVIDIDYSSGKPLQSHAKTPFMATFKICKDIPEEGQDMIPDDQKKTKEVVSFQGAIFKVGDDCRQDVLALQLIAVLKNIFESAGLNTYLFPYRVVASDPGCGVIEVIPNSISRDMIGREKINSLTEYYVSKFGNMHSIEYQKAKRAFWESMAAYSIVLYLLQIKDRHNGNIMIDSAGHIVHIDFGFILDIAPGGNLI